MSYESESHLGGEQHFAAEVTDDGFNVPLLGAEAVPAWRDELSGRIHQRFAMFGAAGLSAMHASLSELTDWDLDSLSFPPPNPSLNSKTKFGPRRNPLLTLFHQGETLFSLAHSATALLEGNAEQTGDVLWNEDDKRMFPFDYPRELASMTVRYSEPSASPQFRQQQMQFGARLADDPSRRLYVTAVIDENPLRRRMNASVHTGHIVDGMVEPSVGNTLTLGSRFRLLKDFGSEMKKSAKKRENYRE